MCVTIGFGNSWYVLVKGFHYVSVRFPWYVHRRRDEGGRATHLLTRTFATQTWHYYYGVIRSLFECTESPIPLLVSDRRILLHRVFERWVNREYDVVLLCHTA